MEIRFRHLFLKVLMLFMLSVSSVAFGADKNTGSDQNKALIQPNISRISFSEAQINADDFELLVSLGYLSIEDFGVNALTSFKLNYYVNEDVFVQLVYGQSDAGLTSFEVISGGAPLLTDSERELSYYSLNVGYNLLQGESFLSQSKAYNSAFFLSAGIGNTQFSGDDRFTFNYGAGYRFLINDQYAVYTDFRNNVFDMDVFGVKKTTNNLEFTLGLSLFF